MLNTENQTDWRDEMMDSFLREVCHATKPKGNVFREILKDSVLTERAGCILYNNVQTNKRLDEPHQNQVNSTHGRPNR